MKKILLVGKEFCFSLNLFFLLKLAGFDPELATNLEQSINLIEIKPNFRLLIFAKSELECGSDAFLEYLNYVCRKVKVIIVDDNVTSGDNSVNINAGLISEDIKFCSSDRIIEQVKGVLRD